MAVKVIDKLRFPTKQESQLRNEVAILQVVIMGNQGEGRRGCHISLVCFAHFGQQSVKKVVWSYFLLFGIEYVHSILCHISHFSESATSGHSEPGVYV